jgi:hypothetical protein
VETPAFAVGESLAHDGPFDFDYFVLGGRQTDRQRHAPSTINQRLAAVRRLTTEAADNGLLDPAVAGAQAAP